MKVDVFWNIQYQDHLECFESFDVVSILPMKFTTCLSSLPQSSVDWYLDYSYKHKTSKYCRKFDPAFVQMHMESNEITSSGRIFRSPGVCDYFNIVRQILMPQGKQIISYDWCFSRSFVPFGRIKISCQTGFDRNKEYCMRKDDSFHIAHPGMNSTGLNITQAWFSC